jgi:tetratricopeptide (TPR) repeat protein
MQHFHKIPGAADLLYTLPNVGEESELGAGTFARVSEIAPAKSSLRMLAVSLLEPRLRDAVETHRESQLLNGQNRWTYRRLQQLLRATGDQQRIIALAERWIALNPLERSGHLDAALGYLATGQADKAVGSIDRALEHLPIDATLAYWKGQALYRLGKYDEAATVLITAIELDPAHLNAHLFLARSYRYQSNIESAGRYYLRAIRLSNGRASIRSEYERWLVGTVR